jgi:leucyl/phenylalanyl-tRNA---protein transferase
VSAPARQAIEPPPSQWVFPTDPTAIAELAGGGEVAGIGADLQPGTLLAAYRAGLFPMPSQRRVMAWWSPDPRGIVPLGPSGLRVSRSLRRSCAQFEVRVDTAFDEVISACADGRRPGAWIDRDIKAAYRRLHDLGWVHSVEAWDSSGRLAGGLYGVAIGGLFAGESMFHRQTDASKVAMVGLISLLGAGGSGADASGSEAGRVEAGGLEADGSRAGADGSRAGVSSGGAGRRLLDVQWATPHLMSLGAVEVSRMRYHELLRDALRLPQPAVFGGGG